MTLPLNTLTMCDCLEGMRALPDKCIDLLITDPPYGVDIAKNSRIGNSTFGIKGTPDYERNKKTGKNMPQLNMIRKIGIMQYQKRILR